MLYVDKVLLNEDGSEASENGKPAMALLGIKRALIADVPNLTAAQKMARFELWTKLVAGGTELTVDEANTAKQAVEIFPTLVYGQLVAFLNQKTNG